MSHVCLLCWEDVPQELFILFLKAGQTRVCAVYVLQFVCASYTEKYNICCIQHSAPVTVLSRQSRNTRPGYFYLQYTPGVFFIDARVDTSRGK